MNGKLTKRCGNDRHLSILIRHGDTIDCCLWTISRSSDGVCSLLCRSCDGVCIDLTVAGVAVGCRSRFTL